MKRKLRLTENDLRGIIKRSVSRILREANGIDDEGLSNSLVDFINNPVDVHKKDVDYNPSDDEINDAINQFNPDDFDLDFSNLDLDDEDEDFYDDNSLDIYDSRKIRGNRLTEGKLRSIVNKSVKKVLREFGSDGPDWEDIDAGDLPNYPGSVGGYSDHVISANDFDDIDVDSLENYDDDDDINYDEIEMYDDLNLESKKRLGRVIKESIRKVLKEEDFIPDLQKYVSDSGFPQRTASKFQRVNKQGGKSFITQQAKAAGQNDPRKIGRMIRKGKGMPLTTYASDGTLETNKPITKDDVVLNNVGNPDNRWSPDIKTFLKKYEPTMVGNIYKPKGGPMYAYGPIQQDISFTSPWGTTEHVKAGGYILQDPKNPNDIYGISGEDFNATYRFDESRRRLGRIVRESINKVLNEGIKAVDPDNIVPQMVAEKYGFKREYIDTKNGLELWGKTIITKKPPLPPAWAGEPTWADKLGADSWKKEEELPPRELLRVLGISRFTTWSKSPYSIKLRITVEPDPRLKQASHFGQIPNRVGDYVANGYGNENGAFFHNPKNGHNKQFKF